MHIEIPLAIPKQSALDLYPKYVTCYDVVVEVGTLFGGGTIVLANLAKHVYSFEPIKYNYNITRRNVKKFTNVELFNIGLGSKREQHEMKLYYNGSSTAYGLSSLREQKQTELQQDVKIKKTERINVDKLDNFHFKLKPTVLISDCEGWECEVLEGARETLESLRIIAIEVHDTSECLNRFFKKYQGEFSIDYNDPLSYPQWFIARRKR